MYRSDTTYNPGIFTIEEFEREYLFGKDQNTRNLTVKTRTRSGKKVRRRTRVKSRARFITFLILTIGLALGTIGFATGINESTASVTQDYTSYTVEAGDTLWDIAGKTCQSHTDVRKMVFVISQLNDLQAEDLRPGMVLTIPVDM